ncbi:MAG: DNA cytosine methyltransferase [Lachnospiraceae bacterium]|nr:DNA cytosine methyltransferase [Lachnospiraceae bacterium]
MSREFTFVDLFAGCGGLSEGFYKEGFRALLHLEINPAACETLKTRMRYYKYSDEDIERSVMCDDITRDGVIEDIERRLSEHVDIIIGGPPCQAFSTVGRAQSPDSMNTDPRNYLFKNYLGILNKLQPELFIFENVKGILTARPQGVRIFEKIISEMRKTYDVVDDPDILLLDAADYGVPQLRERVIIIGIKKGGKIKTTPEEIYKLISKTHSVDGKNGTKKYVTVREAISDLPKLKAGAGTEISHRDNSVKNDYLDKIVSKDGVIHNHVARRHNDKDRERYRILSENKWQLKDLQEVRPDLVHHNPEHFGNRYTVQEFDKPGKTVVAHLYKDGNLFIHPDSEQSRTFTVREAARIQSFPDDFIFKGSRTEQYKQVGNAVPPLMAQALAKVIKKTLEDM